MNAPKTIDLSREATDARLYATLVDITEHPERWMQDIWGKTETTTTEEFALATARGDWPCGTVACLAGNVAIREGLATPSGDGCVLINPAGLQLLWDAWADEQDENSFVHLAATLFGLSLGATSRLTSAANLLADLWRLAEEVTDGRVRLPDTLRSRVLLIDSAREAGDLGLE